MRFIFTLLLFIMPVHLTNCLHIMRSTAYAALLLALCVLAAPLPGCDSGGFKPPPPEPPPGRWQYLGLGGENVVDITAIAVHPSDPNTIYAGSSFDFSAQIHGKLFKTTDGGATWDTLLVGGSHIDIQLDPQNPEVVYALPGGIIKSTDAGETWNVISRDLRIPTIDRRASSLAIDPESPEVLYAGIGGPFSGCPHKSTDGGENWKRLIPKGERSRLCNGVTSLTVDPQHSNIVYVGTAWAGEVFKSTNGGQSWKRSLENTGGIVGFTAVSPHNSELLYAGLRYRDGSLYRSSDGGDSWNRERVGSGAGGMSQIAFAEMKVYLGTDEGIYLSRPGSAWVDMSEGLPAHRRVQEIALGPAGRRLYAGMDRTYVSADEHGLYVRDLTGNEATHR
jgi:photosystem II stability/assembly factor-like uncharacterized protein